MARPAKERTTVTNTTADTVHYETIQLLCSGADYQDAIAVQARKASQEMATEVEALTNRLNDLRPRMARAEQDSLDADRRAVELRRIAAHYCEVNGWDMPAPQAPGEPDGMGEGEPEAAKETDDAEQ